MIVIPNVFPKLKTIKDFVRTPSYKRRFSAFFDSQHVNASQTLVKSSWENFYQIPSALWWELIWKIFPLLTSEILGVFIKTLTADDNYPLQDCENLPLLIQMQ